MILWGPDLSNQCVRLGCFYTRLMEHNVSQHRSVMKQTGLHAFLSHLTRLQFDVEDGSCYVKRLRVITLLTSCVNHSWFIKYLKPLKYAQYLLSVWRTGRNVGELWTLSERGVHSPTPCTSSCPKSSYRRCCLRPPGPDGIDLLTIGSRIIRELFSSDLFFSHTHFYVPLKDFRSFMRYWSCTITLSYVENV